MSGAGVATGEVGCPICAGRLLHPVLAKDGWRVLRCAGCTNGFLTGSPAGGAARESADWFQRTPEACGLLRRRWRAVENAWKAFLSGGDFEGRKLRRVLRWSAGGRLLDIGCAAGQFLGVAQRHFEVQGVEVSPTALEQARVRFGARVFAGDLLEARFSGAAFDVITLFSTVEHLEDPVAVVRECRRVLRDGGILVVKTPNFSSLNRRILRGGWSGYKLPEHRFFFTPRGLGHLFARAGLEPLSSPWFDRFPLSDTMYAYARKGRDGEKDR